MSKPYAVSSLPADKLAELTRLMIEEVKEAAVFFLDVNGIIESWNSAAEDMKGFTAEDAIGKHLSLLYTDEDKAGGWAEHNLQEAKKTAFSGKNAGGNARTAACFGQGSCSLPCAMILATMSDSPRSPST